MRTLKFNVKLNWDIVRGIFDADGSFSQNRLKITTASVYSKPTPANQ